MACYIPRWNTRPKTVTHPSTNRRALTLFMRRTPLTTTPRRQPHSGWHTHRRHSPAAAGTNRLARSVSECGTSADREDHRVHGQTTIIKARLAGGAIKQLVCRLGTCDAAATCELSTHIPRCTSVCARLQQPRLHRSECSLSDRIVCKVSAVADRPARRARAFQFGQKSFDSIRFGNLINLPLVH